MPEQQTCQIITTTAAAPEQNHLHVSDDAAAAPPGRSRASIELLVLSNRYFDETHSFNEQSVLMIEQLANELIQSLDAFGQSTN